MAEAVVTPGPDAPGGGPRVHVVAYSRLPSRTANAVQVARMCAALVRQGARVTLFCRRERGASADEVRRFYGLEERFELRGPSLPRVPLLTRALHSLVVALRVATAPRADLVLGRDVFALALVAALPGKAPIVLELHRPPARRVEAWAQRILFRSARFERLVVISDALARELASRHGEAVAARTVVLRDGSDPVPRTEARPSDAGPSEADPFRVGYVGSLSPGKGMELLAAIAQLLEEGLEDCELHVVGGSPEDVERWSARCPANVRFHGFVPPAEARARVAELDVVLAPYQPEVRVGPGGVDVARWMSPLKVFESMAAGRAILASDLPVLREFLTDGVNARLVPADDAEAWVAAIRALRDDPEARERLGERARTELEAHYTWDERARRLLQCGEESAWTAS